MMRVLFRRCAQQVDALLSVDMIAVFDDDRLFYVLQQIMLFDAFS